MGTKAALKQQSFKEVLAKMAQAKDIEQHKEDRIDKTLHAVVHVEGCGNVKLKDLFCPSGKGAVVVIRRLDGSYHINCEAYQNF